MFPCDSPGEVSFSFAYSSFPPSHFERVSFFSGVQEDLSCCNAMRPALPVSSARWVVSQTMNHFIDFGLDSDSPTMAGGFCRSNLSTLGLWDLSAP